MTDEYKALGLPAAKCREFTRDMFKSITNRGWEVTYSVFSKQLRLTRRAVLDEGRVTRFTFDVEAGSYQEAVEIDAGRQKVTWPYGGSSPAWSTLDNEVHFGIVGKWGTRVHGVSKPHMRAFSRDIKSSKKGRYFDTDAGGKQRRVYIDECVPPLPSPLRKVFVHLLEKRNEAQRQVDAERLGNLDIDPNYISGVVTGLDVAINAIKGHADLGRQPHTHGA